MIFELTTAGNFYSKEKKEKLEKLGFKFRYTNDEYLRATNKPYYKEDVIQIEINTIEINSIEDLMKFIKEYGKIIISKGCISTGCIEIYDDYRE